MKTLKKVTVKLIELKLGEYIPEKINMEFGVIYYSAEFQGSSHLCLYGCGVDRYLPIKFGEWDLFKNDGKVTVTPSIHHRFGCKSHYIITNGIANFV